MHFLEIMVKIFEYEYTIKFESKPVKYFISIQIVFIFKFEHMIGF